MRPTVRLIRNLAVLTGCFAYLFGSDVEGHVRGERFDADQAPLRRAGDPGPIRLASLSIAEREEIAAIARDTPKIDLEIHFEIDSEVLSESAKPAVDALGQALASPELAGGTFVIAGHTDGVESDEYSKELSELRADTVKYELVTRFAIPAANLVTVGYGSAKLKDSMNPFASINDRVQVISMETKPVK